VFRIVLAHLSTQGVACSNEYNESLWSYSDSSRGNRVDARHFAESQEEDAVKIRSHFSVVCWVLDCGVGTAGLCTAHVLSGM
jgi:hypothetical protein